MAAPSASPLRFVTQALLNLARMLGGPSSKLLLTNRSMACWTFELASGGGFREQKGSLIFRLLDPATGHRHFAGSLLNVGDSILLEAGGTYQVELYGAGGTFLRFFRLVDILGNGNGSRFFIEQDAGRPEVVVRLYDGLHGHAGQQPLQHLTPGLLDLAMTVWPKPSQDRGQSL